jgi:hypothetical protein
VLALSAVAYARILGNYFHADDFVNFYWLVTQGPLAYALHPHGGHVLVVRNAVTWALHGVCGTHAACYFVVVLGTHLVNVWLLFDVLRGATGSARLAALGAALWGTSPLAEGSLGWYSVYGHVLAATVLLIVLRDLVRRAGAGGVVGTGRAALWWALLLIGSTCFGVGIAVAVVFPLLAPLVLGRERLARGALVLLATLPAVVLTTYVATYVVHVRVFGGSAETVLGLVDLLTHWTAIARMLVHLIAVGVAGVTLGYVDYPGPLASALAAVFVAGLLVAFQQADAGRRRLLLAAGLLAVAMYGIVAAGRANVFLALGRPLEPWEAATTSRYHYAALLPVVLLLCLALAELGRRLAVAAHVRDAVLAAVLLAVGVRALATARAIDAHGDARQATARVVDGIRALVAAQAPGEAVYVPNQAFPPVRFFERADLRGFPGWAAVFVVFFPDNAVDGRRVYFVVPEELARAAPTSGLRRVDTLLVARGA